MAKKTEARERADFKARDRLAGLSDKALEEVADLVDDVMVIYHSENCLLQANMFRDILIDLVMEQQQRNPNASNEFAQKEIERARREMAEQG